VGRYVLNENDLRTGDYGRHNDDCIAFCDFSFDFHGLGRRVEVLENGPWGVPLGCLQPREVDNLIVACRGSSFSSIAASACRLQRTMVELGEAAGHFVATGRAIRPALPSDRD
jgi:hypothetical protein